MSQAAQLINSIIRNLNSVANKLEGLNDLQNALNSGCSSASFLGQLEKLFSGLRQCLLAEATSIDIVLKSNSVLLEMITDIQHSDDLEIQFAQLIPIFIDNLGSPKAVLRKSTHKCIATYVKLSKKLEFVMLHLVHSGLENSNSRARQHSMLVIPALLSLKPSIIERGAPEIIEMLSRTVKKLKDPYEIVSKTAKKLIIELNKCYPNHFETILVSQLKSEEDKLICRAVLRQDEDEIQRLLTGGASPPVPNPPAPAGNKRYQEETKQVINVPNNQILLNKNQVQYQKELSVVGKEILQSVGGSQLQQNPIARAKDLDKIIYEAKEESRYPKAQNGLLFGFLEQSERTSSIEQIESQLNSILHTDKKMDFMPYATNFLGFMLQYIPDINFKISLTTLVTSLVEKLADSKHGNWHVREGALSLIAHCIISQQQLRQDTSGEGLITQQFVNEIIDIIELEDKQKIQQLIIDVLALIVDKSQDRNKTQSMLQKSLNIQNIPLSSLLDYENTQLSKEQLIYKQIQERVAKGNLPYINEDGIVEFPQNFTSRQQPPVQPSVQNVDSEGTPVQKSTPSQNFLEGKKREEEKKSSVQQNPNPYTQVPSQYSKHEQMLKYSQAQAQQQQQMQQILGQQPPENDKISMWLPSFPAKELENTRISQNSSMFKTDEKNQFNNTSSSVATYLDDGRTTNTTMLSSNQKTAQQLSKGGIHHNSYMKSPAYSEPDKMVEDQSQILNQFGSEAGGIQYQSKGRLGYTPEQHSSKPRSIQSNELRQRNQANAQQNYYNNTDKAKDIENPFAIGLPSQLGKQTFNYDNSYRNMSQSSGVPGGFGVSGQPPQVTDRLQLLKTKYNPKPDDQRDQDESNDYENNTSFTQIYHKPVSKQNSIPTAKISSGPIKPQIPTQQFIQTIGSEEYESTTPQVKQQTKKPPLTQKSSMNAVNKSNQNIGPRAQSLDANEQQNLAANTGDNYQPVLEPFPNPESQFKQAFDQLQSGDWSKQFEACNTIKRIAMFHKNLLSFQNPTQLPLIKELVKLVDSLRSQLAKNAILALISMYENLPNRDMDPSIDQILPNLLKKAADTNIFIAETADKALASLCTFCSENKVFGSLQSQNCKSNPMKVKLALCYNILIERIGGRVRQFQNLEKLIQSVCSLLNEGAIEVRNMAKVGLIQMKVALGSQRELEQLLMRFISNEKQFDKIKGILDKGEFDSISQTGSTRYGTSMRGSSLDSRSAGPARGGQGNHISASGSDGFGQFSTSEFNLQNSYVRGGVSHHTAKAGFGQTSNGFKKNPQTVTKPVDPLLMEEFRQIINELQTNDWNKRLKAIDTMTEWIQINQNTIKTTQSSKFISLIDTYAKILQDNNAKVLSQAQQSFKQILINPNLKHLVEQSLALIISALCSNLSSSNMQVREQGEHLFNTLEEVIDLNLLLSPIIAQINLSNHKAKVQLIERLTCRILFQQYLEMVERCDKQAAVQKLITPMLQAGHKVQVEAASNPRLKEALNRLASVFQ